MKPISWTGTLSALPGHRLVRYPEYDMMALPFEDRSSTSCSIPIPGTCAGPDERTVRVPPGPSSRRSPSLYGTCGGGEGSRGEEKGCR